MTQPAGERVALADAHGEAARAVLHAAFLDDPTFRWCFGADEPGYADRLAGYIEVGDAWHRGLGQPAAGIVVDGTLDAVAYAMTPDLDAPAEAVRALEEDLARRCGAASAQRFARYNHEVGEAVPVRPLHVLALLAVHPRRQGTGLGTRLATWVGALCDADPGSEGVVLDTGNPANLPFYARLGYAPVATVQVGPLREHLLLRPRRTGAAPAR